MIDEPKEYLRETASQSLAVIFEGRIETLTKVSLQAGESYELWPAGDLEVTPAYFHFTPCSTLSKYFVMCSSEKRSVRRAR